MDVRVGPWAECQGINAFEQWCWGRLNLPINCGTPVNLKGKQSLIFIRRTDAEVEAPVLWPRDVTS